MVRAHVFVEGRVQGVFFRVWTKKKAESLGLTGWVRNLSDGKVEIVAEGEKSELTKLIELIKKGPKFSRAEHVDINREAATGEFKIFEIRY